MLGLRAFAGALVDRMRAWVRKVVAVLAPATPDVGKLILSF